MPATGNFARRVAASAALTAGLLVASSCQEQATMWADCSPAADENPTGYAGDYVLTCEDGEWVPVMTVNEFLQSARGESVTIAPLPTRPTTSTTSTTTSTTVPGPTVDQSSTGSLNSAIGIGACGPSEFAISVAQTFTPAATGSLSRVSFFGLATGSTPLRISVRTTSGGAPTSTELATVDLPTIGAPTSYEWIDVPLTSPVDVTSGTTYALVFGADGGCPSSASWTMALSSENPYAGGSGFFSAFTNPGLVADSADFAFKTWMD